MKLTATFVPQTVTVDIAGQNLSIGTGIPVARDYVERPAYEGPYTITPTTEAQILETRNLRMTDNITVKPIPHNYGLISWTGPGIRVS